MILYSTSIDIAAPASLTRAQFADLAHHSEAAVHAGVTFEVLDDSDGRCTYVQRTRTGPFRTTQELELLRRPDGTLLNAIRRGPFRGATIGFTVTETTSDRCRVEARFESDRRLHRMFRPVIALIVGSALRRALAEDRDEIESGNYPRSNDAR